MICNLFNSKKPGRDIIYVKILLLLTFLFSNTIFAQFKPNEESGFAVDTIRLEYALVPKVHALKNNNAGVVAKINAWILGEYGMKSWEDRYGGLWGQASLTLIGYKIQHDFLILDMYMVSRGNDSNRKYFISLISGNEIKPVDVPFSSLFTPDQYLNFIEKYWVNDLKKELSESYTCCEADLDKDWLNELSYGVVGFSFAREKLQMKEYRWGPSGHCWGACGTWLEKEIDLKEVNPYLNSFGRDLAQDATYKKNNHYFGDSWDEDTSVEEVIYSISLRDQIPENLFFLGKIAGKYPFKMSLNVEDIGYEELITGSYFYTSNSDKFIMLKGHRSKDTLVMKEYVNGEVTGSLKFEEIRTKYSTDWEGTWTSADGKQMHEVSLTASF